MSFTFFDAFCGIGGFRLGLEAAGGTCVGANDNDKFCATTYCDWFGTDGFQLTDIRNIEPRTLPDFDLLCAGFPCQPFSQAGVTKRQSMGRPHGLEDLDKGNLFFWLMEIVKAKQPKVVFFENVSNLLTHDKGNTWAVMNAALIEAGYFVQVAVINSKSWVPQSRERVYIVAFRSPVAFGHFQFPLLKPGTQPVLHEILDAEVDPKYTLSDKTWQYLKDYRAKHQAKGNGFGYSFGDFYGPTRTLSARYGKDGSEILIDQPGKNPRKLTPRECARLMGFPDDLKIVVSDTQAYKQFGNAVVPKVVRTIAGRIVEAMQWEPSDWSSSG